MNTTITQAADCFTLPCYNGREGTQTFRVMTLPEVLALQSGSRCWIRSNSGDARRVKINGKVKRWKREPERFEVPVKYGMYECARLYNSDLSRFLVPVDFAPRTFATADDVPGDYCPIQGYYYPVIIGSYKTLVRLDYNNLLSFVALPNDR